MTYLRLSTKNYKWIEKQNKERVDSYTSQEIRIINPLLKACILLQGGAKAVYQNKIMKKKRKKSP